MFFMIPSFVHKTQTYYETNCDEVLFQSWKERTCIMKVTPVQAEKVLTINQKYSQLGFSMMLTRLKSRYSGDPSPDNLEFCTSEINTFLTKFTTIMGPDYATMTNL